MTREEAIEFGNMWLEINKDCKDSNTYAFFQLAVKLLEQLCDDEVISKQAVLKQLKGCLTGGETEYNYVKIHIDSIPPI